MVYPVGGHVGRYQLLRELSRTPSVQYVAFDAALDRTVVVELLEASSAAATERRLEHARTLADISEPGWPAVHDVDREGEVAFVARERVEGVSLGDWMPSDWHGVRRALAHAAGVLAAVHQRGLGYGELDPHAFVVREDGRLALVAPFALLSTDTDPRADLVGLTSTFDEQLPRWTAERPAPRWLRALLGGEPSSASALAAEAARDPTARRRRVLGAAGLLGLGGAALLAYSRAQATERRACDDGRERGVGVWNDEAESAVERALRETHVPFVEPVLGSVDSALDDYVTRWAEAHDEVCRATRIERRVTEADAERQVICLDRRLGELRALIEVLTEADAGVARNAVQATQSLRDPGACHHPDEPTLDPVSAEQMARARALYGAGKDDDALEVLDTIVEGWSADSDLAGLAQARMLRGRLRVQVGQQHEGEAEIRRAIGEAWRAGDDRLAAEGWAHLVFYRAEHLADFEGARLAESHARAAIERIGGDTATERILHTASGVLAFHDARYDAAIEEYRTVLDMPGGSELQIARTTVNLANAMVRADRLPEAQPLLRRALDIRRRILGEQHPATAATRGSLGAALKGERRFEEALEQLQQAHEVNVAALGEDHPATIQSLGNIGAVAADLELWDLAASALERTLERQRALLGPEHPELYYVVLNLAAVEKGRARHLRALERCRDAESIATRAYGDEHPFVAMAVMCEADALAASQRHDEAAHAYERARDMRERTLGSGHRMVAVSSIGLGRALLRLGEPAGAISAFRQAVEVHEEREGEPGELATARLWLARAQWSAGQKDEARAIARLALEAARAADDPKWMREVHRWLEQHRG